jgi:hypothetical protein
MKILLSFFLLSQIAHADCVLPGLVSFARQNGLDPHCHMVGTQGVISLQGDARFSWSRLKVGPSGDMTSLKITGNYNATHVVRGPVVIAGPVTAEGPLAIFSAQLTTEAGGSISAPEVVVSALLPTADEDADGYFSGQSITLNVVRSPDTAVPGTLTNHGKITATQGNLTLLGRSIQTDGTLLAAKGTVRLVAADKVSVTNTSATALHGQVALGNSIYNAGTIQGLKVEMRAVPRSCPNRNCTFLIDTPIINQGKIKGTAKLRGVTFDVSGGTEDGLHSRGQVEDRIEPEKSGKSGLIVTPDFRPLLANDPTYVVGGPLITSTKQVVPVDGDSPAVTPSRVPSSGTTPVSVPLLPPASAAGLVLRAQPSKVAAQGAAAGTRGNSTTASAEEAPARKKPARPVVRGAFFGVPVKAGN